MINAIQNAGLLSNTVATGKTKENFLETLKIFIDKLKIKGANMS
jgi:hypothetical protein